MGGTKDHKGKTIGLLQTYSLCTTKKLVSTRMYDAYGPFVPKAKFYIHEHVWFELKRGSLIKRVDPRGFHLYLEDMFPRTSSTYCKQHDCQGYVFQGQDQSQ